MMRFGMLEFFAAEDPESLFTLSTWEVKKLLLFYFF